MLAYVAVPLLTHRRNTGPRHRADVPRRGEATQAGFLEVDHIDVQHENNSLSMSALSAVVLREKLRSDCVGQAKLACLTVHNSTPLQAAWLLPCYLRVSSV
jgi:hypothetical protein